VQRHDVDKVLRTSYSARNDSVSADSVSPIGNKAKAWEISVGFQRYNENSRPKAAVVRYCMEF
jgi:hypothetical protein